MVIAKTPKTPYYAVIFTSQLSNNTKNYEEMADKMVALASKQPGFLGLESARDSLGITVSYWESINSIKAWKNNVDHKLAQKLGKEKWYSSYKTRITKVEYDYDFNLK